MHIFHKGFGVYRRHSLFVCLFARSYFNDFLMLHHLVTDYTLSTIKGGFSVPIYARESCLMDYRASRDVSPV